MPTTHLQTRPLAGEQMLLCLKEAEIRVLSTLDLQDNIIRHAASCNKKTLFRLKLEGKANTHFAVQGCILHANIHACCESNALSDAEEMK